MLLFVSAFRRIHEKDEFDIENEDTGNRSGAREAISDEMVEAFKIALKVTEIC